MRALSIKNVSVLKLGFWASVSLLWYLGGFSVTLGIVIPVLMVYGVIKWQMVHTAELTDHIGAFNEARVYTPSHIKRRHHR